MALFVAALYLAPLIGIPVAAAKGTGYRGVYFAGTVVGLALFAFVYALTSGPMPPVATEAERVGAELLRTSGPPVGVWFLTTAIGCLLGACLYRPHGRAQMTEA